MSEGAPSADLLGVRLRTPRLALRPVRPADTAALFAIFSDPDVSRYWSSPAWTSPAQAEAMIAGDVASALRGAAVRLAVLREPERDDDDGDGDGDGELIGAASLFALDPGNRRAEVGYALRRNSWGLGYATEAMAAIVRWAFTDLRLHRLEADLDPRNDASARVLVRLGFRPEGLLRQRWIVAGEVSDSAMYGLLAHEWFDAELGS